MTTDDLLVAVAPLADCLTQLGVRFFLTGSAASSAHGVARASLDVDLVAELDPPHVDRFIACLADAYYVPVGLVRAAAAERRSFNLIHLATMFKVDVFVSRRRDYDLVAADRAQLESIDEQPGSPRVPTATAEDTVLRKLEWFRGGGEVSERQWWDVVGVLKVSRQADRGYLRNWAARLGVADLLDRALTQADEEEAEG